MPAMRGTGETVYRASAAIVQPESMASQADERVRASPVACQSHGHRSEHRHLQLAVCGSL